ncbi:MAG: AbrB/MazE/SpoVT family DNA-binding domain-containing protein [Egibacteraceae bacterium]
MGAVRIKVDASGRVVIPQSLRRDFGVEHGGHLLLIDHDGRLELRRDPGDVQIRTVDGFPVLTVAGEEVVFTADDVRTALDDARSS